MPRAALEREAKILPLDLYCDALIMNKALDEKDNKVREEIKQTVNAIWETEQQRPPQSTQRRRDPREVRQRPLISSEQVQQKAIEKQLEIRGYRAHLAERAEREGPRRARRPRANRAPPGRPQKEKSIINEWTELEWQRRWRLQARNRKATTWKTPWTQSTLKLYSDMPKHQASALFLLRTEVLGLNGWLTSINVPVILANCGCGGVTQTVHHVQRYCHDHLAISIDMGW